MVRVLFFAKVMVLGQVLQKIFPKENFDGSKKRKCSKFVKPYDLTI